MSGKQFPALDIHCTAGLPLGVCLRGQNPIGGSNITHFNKLLLLFSFIPASNNWEETIAPFFFSGN